MARDTSEPVAIKIAFGLAASLRMYAPLAVPVAGAHSERSKTGRFWRDRRIPAARPRVRIFFQLSATSLASPGRMTSKPGIARKAAKCSMGWCVGPSSPTPIESCVQTNVEGIFISAARRTAGRM